MEIAINNSVLLFLASLRTNGNRFLDIATLPHTPVVHGALRLVLLRVNEALQEQPQRRVQVVLAGVLAQVQFRVRLREPDDALDVADGHRHPGCKATGNACHSLVPQNKPPYSFSADKVYSELACVN